MVSFEERKMIFIQSLMHFNMHKVIILFTFVIIYINILCTGESNSALKDRVPMYKGIFIVNYALGIDVWSK